MIVFFGTLLILVLKQLTPTISVGCPSLLLHMRFMEQPVEVIGDFPPPDNSVGIHLKSHANYNSNSDTNEFLLFLLWHVLPSTRCKLAVAVNSYHIV